MEIKSFQHANDSMLVTISVTDILTSKAPEFLLGNIMHQISRRYVDAHYDEIEKLIDPKVVASLVSALAAEKVEEKLRDEFKAAVEQLTRSISKVRSQANRRLF